MRFLPQYFSRKIKTYNSCQWSPPKTETKPMFRMWSQFFKASNFKTAYQKGTWYSKWHEKKATTIGPRAHLNGHTPAWPPTKKKGRTPRLILYVQKPIIAKSVPPVRHHLAHSSHTILVKCTFLDLCVWRIWAHDAALAVPGGFSFCIMVTPWIQTPSEPLHSAQTMCAALRAFSCAATAHVALLRSTVPFQAGARM